MQGTPEELADFANRVRRGNEVYRTVPDANSMAAIIAPIIGSMIGVQNGQRVPQMAGGQSVHDALYASTVVNRQWEITMQRAVYEFSQSVGKAAADISSNVGLSRAIGMSASQLQAKMQSLVTSPAGLFGAQSLMQSSGMQMMLGGNPLQAYQNIFANRHLFTPYGSIGVHPYDAYGQERALRQPAEDFASRLVRAAYASPTGGTGVIPNYNFTRGFQVQDLANVAVSAMEKGRLLDGGMVQMGQIARVLESLSNLMGSNDMNSIMSSLNRLTNNNWARMDWNRLHKAFAEIGSTAQLLNVSNPEMLNTVSTVQSSLQQAIGVTPTQVMLGKPGGGWGGLNTALMLSRRVYAIAEATGARSSEDIARISAEQVGVFSMGLQSQQGRASRLAAYLQQEGVGNSELYAQYRNAMLTGSAAYANTAARRYFDASLPGGYAAARGMFNNYGFMRYVDERTGEDARRAAIGDINNMQIYEYSARMSDASDMRLSRQVQYMRERSGSAFALSPDARAAANMAGVRGFFNAVNPAIGNELDSIFKGAGSGWTAWNAVERYAQSAENVRGFWPAATRRAGSSAISAEAAAIDKAQYISARESRAVALLGAGASPSAVEAARTSAREAATREFSQLSAERQWSSIAKLRGITPMAMVGMIGDIGTQLSGLAGSDLSTDSRAAVAARLGAYKGMMPASDLNVVNSGTSAEIRALAGTYKAMGVSAIADMAYVDRKLGLGDLGNGWISDAVKGADRYRMVAKQSQELAAYQTVLGDQYQQVLRLTPMQAAAELASGRIGMQGALRLLGDSPEKAASAQKMLTTRAIDFLESRKDQMGFFERNRYEKYVNEYREAEGTFAGKARQRYASERLGIIMQKRLEKEQEGGGQAKGGKGELTLSGTLQLLDSNGYPTGRTVHIQASGS